MNIYGLTKDKLADYFETLGEKKFKAIQVFQWLYQKDINDFNQWSDMKKSVQEQLSKDFKWNLPVIIKREIDEDTEKYLFLLEDQERVEAVLMKHNYGQSICISSEVGCNMGCKFCESGRLKKVRSLNVAEMVGQVIQIQRLVKERIDSVVLMGIGEPFDNYENVIDFISIINDPNGCSIGSRHITVSTCGIIPKIKEFSQLPWQVNLAISLHAPNNELRNKIMPINKVYPLDELMMTLKEYIAKTNRRVTMEYVMLQNVNDKVTCAEELSNLLKGMNVYVNLIPYNETNHIEFKKSSKEQIAIFKSVLEKNHINVTVRKSFGRNISAACGQLRSKEVK